MYLPSLRQREGEGTVTCTGFVAIVLGSEVSTVAGKSCRPSGLCRASSTGAHWGISGNIKLRDKNNVNETVSLLQRTSKILF